jgi:hypothetical protein
MAAVGQHKQIWHIEMLITTFFQDHRYLQDEILEWKTPGFGPDLAILPQHLTSI